MFIVNLTYTVPLSQVDDHLEAHIAYLNDQYDQNHFHASGRKVPRTGGIILSLLTDRDQLERILEQDPFKIHNLANYEVTEFIPSKASPVLNALLK